MTPILIASPSPIRHGFVLVEVFTGDALMTFLIPATFARATAEKLWRAADAIETKGDIEQ